MKSAKNFLIKNWKTSLCGLFMAILSYLKSSNHIDENTMTLGIAVGASLTAIFSKDADKTGVK